MICFRRLYYVAAEDSIYAVKIEGCGRAWNVRGWKSECRSGKSLKDQTYPFLGCTCEHLYNVIHVLRSRVGQ